MKRASNRSRFLASVIPALLIVSINPACGDNASKPKQFPLTTTIDYYAVWSGQHDLIAYIHDRIPYSDDPDSSGIYIIRPDGTEKRLFYRSELTFGIDWSDDGMWLVANTAGRLVKIPYPDGQVDTLTPSGEYWSPVWSPDGGHIAFSKHLGSEAGVYIMDSDGANDRLVIRYGKAVDWPFPDSLLYINLGWALPLGAICMTDTTGNFKRVVYMLPERVAPDNLAPRLHAFTGRIVLHAHAYGDTQSIWTLEPGSEQATQLRRFGLRPNFSPAGHKIVFTDTHKDNGRLWIMNWDGSGLTQLTF